MAQALEQWEEASQEFDAAATVILVDPVRVLDQA